VSRALHLIYVSVCCAGNFNATDGEDWLLLPTDPLFETIGKQYHQILIQEYGTDHLYNADMYDVLAVIFLILPNLRLNLQV
jgi:hypothetical protein